MEYKFKTIGLLAKYQEKTVIETIEHLSNYLMDRSIEITVDPHIAEALPDYSFKAVDREIIGQSVDLVVVIGGDGSILNAARAVSDFDVPVLGINRGRLGFLADINPLQLEQELEKILQGEYFEEQRFLLNTKISSEKDNDTSHLALNDVVLYHGHLARMVEFEVYINGQFVCHQRSDGLIVATPTGSTAYNLSAGGPIIHPDLDAMVLMPMFPHTLSSRPIVISASSQIKLVISKKSENEPKLSFDSQQHYDIRLGDFIYIERAPHQLKLIHPPQHNYFEVLRKKLGWSTNWSSDRYSTNGE